MEILISSLMSQLNEFLFVFIRISTLFTMAPFFSSHLIPVKIRIIFAILISLISFSFIDTGQHHDIFSLNGLIIIAQEIFIGFCIGMIFHLVFQILVAAGELIGTQTGLGFASLVDPQNHESLPIISEFFMMSSMLLFLLFNGHLFLIRMIIDSFNTFPIGGVISNKPIITTIIEFSGDIFSSAVSIALPAICALLIVNLTFGFISRAVPQVNLINIGFGITLIMGVFVLTISYPSIMNHTNEFFEKGFSLVNLISKGP